MIYKISKSLQHHKLLHYLIKLCMGRLALSSPTIILEVNNDYLIIRSE